MMNIYVVVKVVIFGIEVLVSLMMIKENFFWVMSVVLVCSCLCCVIFFCWVVNILVVILVVVVIVVRVSVIGSIEMSFFGLIDRLIFRKKIVVNKLCSGVSIMCVWFVVFLVSVRFIRNVFIVVDVCSDLVIVVMIKVMFSICNNNCLELG